MKYVKTSTIALFVILCSKVFAQENITIKGMRLGVSLKEFSEKFPDHDCSSNSACYYFNTVTCLNSKGNQPYSSAKFQECLQRNTFGGSQIIDATSYFENGKLSSYRLTFGASSFDFLIEAITSKYGKPSSMTTHEMQNKLGASFINKKGLWSVADTQLTISKYCGTTEKSCVNVISQADFEAQQKSVSEQQLKSANDF